MTDEDRRATAREIAEKHLDAGDPLGWFEDLYARAASDPSMVPWADLVSNPNLVEWLARRESVVSGPALVVGCGFGDDAEELARRGLETTAFDIAPSVIAKCRLRFPGSRVSYVAADLLTPPAEWLGSFGFVFEAYTIQALPPDLHEGAMRSIASCVAPGGTLLVVARGREPDEPVGRIRWPLTKDELALFASRGLEEVSFEDYMDDENPPARRFRAVYRRARS